MVVKLNGDVISDKTNFCPSPTLDAGDGGGGGCVGVREGEEEHVCTGKGRRKEKGEYLQHTTK